MARRRLIESAAFPLLVPWRCTPSDPLLLVFYVYVLSVNYAFVFFLLLTCAAAAVGGTSGLRTACLRSGPRRLLCAIHDFSQFVRSLGQPFAGRVHGGRVCSFQ